MLAAGGHRDAARDLYVANAYMMERCSIMYAEDLVRWKEPAKALEVADRLEPGCGRAKTRGYALVGLERYDAAVEASDEALRVCKKHDTRLLLQESTSEY